MTQEGLKRQLGWGTAAAILVGHVIGVGIFLTPAGMAKSLGSPAWLLAVWLVMGALTLAGALCIGELAARLPHAGGLYVYLREAFGPRVAFVYGWMCLVVMDPGITAALAAGLAGYVGYLFDLSQRASATAAIIALLVLATVNILGIKPGAFVMLALTVLKLGLLGVVVVWGFGFGEGDWSNFTPFVDQRPGSAPLFGALAGGLVGAFFSFAGWWDVSKIAGEVRDPERSLPRALALGIVIVTIVYTATSAVFFYLVPLDRVTTPETFAALAGEALFGPLGGRVFAAIVCVCVLGSLTGLTMAAPRVYFAMASDGLFPKAMAAVHPRFGTPARAIALQAALACLLVGLGTFDEIISYFVFSAVAFLGLTAAGLFVLRRRGGGEAGFRTPGYPLTLVVFLAMIVVLLVLLLGNSPKQALIGAGIVALGAPVYQILFRGSRAIRESL